MREDTPVDLETTHDAIISLLADLNTSVIIRSDVGNWDICILPLEIVFLPLIFVRCVQLRCFFTCSAISAHVANHTPAYDFMEVINSSNILSRDGRPIIWGCMVRINEPPSS